MNQKGLINTVQTLEGLFGGQFESTLADGTRAAGDAVSAGLTDAEIAACASAERKIVFGALNAGLTIAFTPKPAAPK